MSSHPEGARPAEPVGRRTTPRQGRRTQRQRNEETRRALLRAGNELLREVGYAGISVAQITRRAGRAHGTFYLHFDNKRDLVAVLLDTMAERARDEAREIWRTSSDVEAVWRGFRDFLASSASGRTLWVLLEEVVALEEDAAELRTRLRQLYVEPIRQGLQQRAAERDAAGADLDLVAHLLASAALHFARTGTLPASPDLTALHITVVWCRAVGWEFTEADLVRLHRLFTAEGPEAPPAPGSTRPPRAP